MEYIEGKTLKQLLKKRGTLTLSEAIDIMSQLTDGMAHAHDSYIIHRDLKPQNIMIKDDGQIKITDFGIAMALNSTQLTQTNSVMGSVHYLPPEQASGKGCTIKSDIYSMGIIFYELLSGSLPFKGDNAVEIALKHMREPLPSLREENSAIPQSIENIVKKATAKNPKNRYDSARSMHEDLLTALDDSRMDEPVYQYKYPENEIDSKRIKKLEETAKLETTDDIGDFTEKTIEQPDATGIDDIQDKNSKKLIIILASIFGASALLLIILFFIVPAFSNKKAVTVPDCEKLKVSECEKRLKRSGFEVKDVKTVFSSKIKKNRVVKTSPAKGRSVKKGSKVTIYKSKGEETIALEDYKGKNSIEIKTRLEEKYGLVVNIEKKEPEDQTKEYKDEDEIIGQSKPKGTKVKKGDDLILYTPNIVDKFPDMAGEGWSVDDAATFCDKYELVLEKVEQETEAYSPGTIISQSRTAGTTIIKGTTLRVTVAVKPKPKPTPTPVPQEPEEQEEEPATP